MDYKLFKSKAMAKIIRHQKIKNDIDTIVDLQQQDNIDPETLYKYKRIAEINFEQKNQFFDSLSSSSIFSGGLKKMELQSQYKNDVVPSTKIINNLSVNKFFEDIKDFTCNTKKQQTGSQLINNVIKINDMHYNKAKSQATVDFRGNYLAVKNLNRIINGNGHIVSYDTETFGGTNAFGHQEIDFITELSASIHSFKDGKMVSKKTGMDTFLGFSENEAKYWSNYVSQIDMQHLSEKDKVILHRLGIYGHKDTEIVSHGFRHEVVKSVDGKDVVLDKQKALDTINNVFRKAGIEQEEWLKKNNINSSLEDYRKNYLKEFQDLIYNGKNSSTQLDNFVSVGYNSTLADNPWINKMTGRNLSPEAGKHLDLYTSLTYINENLGRENVHIPGYTASNEYGLTQLEQLTRMYGLFDENNVAAHIARQDQETMAKLLYEPIKTKKGSMTFLQHITTQLDEVNKILAPVSGIHNDNNIYYMNSTIQKNWANANGALNFVFDPLSKNFKTFNGYEIDSKGIVKKADYNQFGPKANALYKHNVFEVDLKDENFKQMFIDNLGGTESQYNKLYQEYSDVDKLYLIKSQEYINDKAVKKRFGRKNIFKERPEYFTLVSNKEQIPAMLGTKIAVDENGKLNFDLKALEQLDFKKVTVDKKGKVIIKDVKKAADIKDGIINRSVDRVINDGAARIIRDMDYKKINKIRQMRNTYDDSMANVVSRMIAENKTLSLNVIDELREQFGWFNFRDESYHLGSETVRNIAALDQYFDSTDKLFNIIDNVLNSEFGYTGETVEQNGKKKFKDYGNKKAWAKKNFALNNIMTNLLEDASKDATPIDLNKEAFLTSKELFRIDFNKFDIFPEEFSKTMGATLDARANDIVTLDLTKNDALLNLFHKQKFKNIDLSKKGNSGFDVLLKAYDVIEKDSRFENVWKNLSREEVLSYQNKNTSQLNDKMMEEIKRFVKVQREQKDKSGFGLLHPRTVQSVDNIEKIQNFINNTSEEELTKKITKYAKDSVHDFHFAKDSSKDAINDLLNNYFFDFTEKELDEQLKGYSLHEQKYFKKKYHLAKQEATNTAYDLLESIKDTDINLIMTKGDNPALLLQQGNKVNQLDMHRYKFHNGIIYYGLNENDYVDRLAFDTSSYVSNFGKVSDRKFNLQKDIQMTNSADKATRGMSFKKGRRYAEQSQKDVYDNLIYTGKKRAKSLREETSRIAMKNAEEYNQSTKFDINDIFRILPELEDEGIISKVEDISKGTISKEDSQLFRNFISKMRRGEFRPGSIEELLASEKTNYIMKYHSGLMQVLSEDLYDEIIDDETVGTISNKNIIKNLGLRNKDTGIQKGYVSGTEYYMHPFATNDKTSRPPVTQMGNAVIYNKEQVKKNIEAAKKGSVEIFDPENFNLNPVVSNNLSKKYLYNIKNNHSEYSAGLSLRYLQTDTNSLRSVFEEDTNNKNGKISSFLKSKQIALNESEAIDASSNIANRLMNFSTYEQQVLMNARMHDIAFYKNNSQLINAKKGLFLHHAENLEIIETLKEIDKLPYDIIDGKIKYQLGTQIKADDVIGKFGSEGNNTLYKAKRDGILRLRFFDEFDNIISEKDINKVISVNNLKDTKEIDSFLKKNFKLNYQILDLEETYGHKIFFPASEKGTIDPLKIRIGELDKSLRKELIELGHENFVDKVIEKETLDEYLFPKLKEANKHELIEKILNERYALSDFLQEYDAFKGISVFSNFNSLKHESFSMAMDSVFNKLRNENKLNNEHLDPILGKGNYIIENGTVNISNTDKVRVSGFDKLNISDDVKTTLNNAFENIEYVTKDGKRVSLKAGEDLSNIIGSTGMTHMLHILDDSSGTYMSDSNINNLYEYKGYLKEQIDSYKEYLSSGNLSKEDKEVAKRLIGETRLKIYDLDDHIEQTVLKMQDHKGLKYSNRTNLNLQKFVYQNDSFNIVKNAFEDKEEFKNIFSHVLDEKGNISNEYLGKSILEPFTELSKDKLLLGDNEIKLSNLQYMSKNQQEKYKYLSKHFEGMKDQISINKAEQYYSYAQGTKALFYNQKKTKDSSTLKKLQKDGFELVDLSSANPLVDNEWLNLDIGGQGNTISNATNNPYSNNLIIKTGLGGNHEYLAIGRMPEKHFEDTLIKPTHIGELTSLQNVLKEIKSNELSEDERESKINYAKSKIDEIVKLQAHDINSKEGLFGDLASTRLSQSFYGKASGLVINNLGNGPGAHNIDDLMRSNSNFLSKAKFKGKTMLEHYSEGKVFDTVAISSKAFEKMGYFEEDFMNKVFDNMSDSIKKEVVKDLDLSKKRNKTTAMENLLETYGDTFLTVRFPEILENSDTVAMGYLDKTLHGNQIKVVAHTGIRMKLDHDGDSLFVTRMSTNDKKSYLNYITSVNPNEKVSELAHATESIMGIHSVTENIHYDKRASEKIQKEVQVAMAGDHVGSIMKNKIIEDHVYGSFTPGKKTFSEMQENFNNYINVMKEAQDQFNNLTKSEQKESSINNEAVKIIKDKYGEDSSKHIENYIEATLFQQYRDDATAKIFKAAVGEVNITNYKMKNAMIALMDKTTDNYEYNSKLIFDLFYQSEEAAISAKSTVEGLSPERAKTWNTAIKNVITGKDTMHNRQVMVDWMKDNVIEDSKLDMYYDTLSSFQQYAKNTFNVNNAEEFKNLITKNKDAKKEIQGKMVNDLADVVQQIGEQNPGVNKLINFYSVGNSLTGVSADRALDAVITHDFEGASDKVIKVLRDTELLDGFMKVTELGSNSEVKEEKFTKNIIDNIISNEEKQHTVKKSFGHELVEGITEIAHGIKGSNIAMGALGLAAGVMMAGFIGGRPQPTQQQAMQNVEDYKENDMSLVDPGISLSQTNPQQGYVVNINARTNKSKRKTIDALQQVLSNSTSSDINVTMNINDNYGNIEDRDIEKFIADAFR